LENDRNPDGYHSYLTNVFDFPLMFAVTQAFNENDGWTTGLSRLYEVFSQDLVYSNPMNLVIFADNHDGSRVFTKLGEDMNRFKMAMTVILTARGIPQVYYGTEIVMTGDEHKGHGFIRKDFPGGWPGDSLNAFTEEGRTTNQQEAFTFVKTLLNWRKNKEVVHSGKFKHFIPADDLYVYFRYDDSDTVMVILNNANQERTFKPERYNEMLNGHFSARSVMDGKNYEINQPFTVLPKSSLILEMD
jgi:glycosidase